MSSRITKVIAGDRQATVEFYRTFFPKIANFVKKKLPLEDAKEIANDVFLEAIDNLPKLREDKHINAWLFSIAHNKIVDYYRKKKIKSLLLSQVPFLEDIHREVQQPEFELEKNRIRDNIEHTFRVLAKKYQKILKMHYEDGIPVKILADKLNLSFRATQSLLFRARQSFKKVYERT